MADKSLEIHPETLTEFKTGVVWYLDKSQSAVVNFMPEIDRPSN